MKISAYITSYNQKDYLKEAIDSIISQTLRPYEIIIVDDASTDGSVDLIRSYEINFPGWIKAIYNSINQGISVCRTKAIESATGDYITWVDGDDYFFPQKLEKESSLLKDGKYQIAFSNYYLSKNELFNYSKIWAFNFDELPVPGTMFKEVISRSFPRGMLYRSELIKLDLLKRTDLYDHNLKIYEDYDLRIRLSKTAKIIYTIEPHSIYRLHGEGLSRAPLSLHLESINYIFSKYQDIVDQLPEKEKLEVRQKQVQLLKRFESGSPTPSSKDRIKQKLISLINKI